MNTIAYAKTPQLVVLVHGEQPPGEEDWRIYIDFLIAHMEATGMRRVLVFSEGGAPTPKQRIYMDSRCAQFYSAVRVAILTHSTFVRGVVNAYALLRPGYKAFAPENTGAALAWLGVENEHGLIDELIVQLRARVTGPER